MIASSILSATWGSSRFNALSNVLVVFNAYFTSFPQLLSEFRVVANPPLSGVLSSFLDLPHDLRVLSYLNGLHDLFEEVADAPKELPVLLRYELSCVIHQGSLRFRGLYLYLFKRYSISPEV